MLAQPAAAGSVRNASLDGNSAVNGWSGWPFRSYEAGESAKLNNSSKFCILSDKRPTKERALFMCGNNDTGGIRL